MNLAAKLNLSGPVTLNLFQGPSGRTRGASRIGTQLAAQRATARSVWGAKWTLNQVQGDEVGSGASFV